LTTTSLAEFLLTVGISFVINRPTRRTATPWAAVRDRHAGEHHLAAVCDRPRGFGSY
jgi:hypothetical protein